MMTNSIQPHLRQLVIIFPARGQ